MTVMCVWNQWREECHLQRRAGTGPCNVATAWDDRHLVHIHSVELMLEYCNGFRPVCFNSLSRSYEVWTSGSHAIVLDASPETTNASDCNGHVNAITGVLCDKM